MRASRARKTLQGQARERQRECRKRRSCSPCVSDTSDCSSISDVSAVSSQSGKFSASVFKAIREVHVTDSPVKKPRNLRQRASEAYKKLPKDVTTKCSVIHYNFLRTYKSPRSKHCIRKLLNSSLEFRAIADDVLQTNSDKSDLNSKLYKDLMKIKELRCKRKYKDILAIRLEWETKHKLSIREVARRTKMTHSNLFRLLIPPVCKSARKVSSGDVSNVRNFFMAPAATMCLPMRRYAGRYYFRNPVAEIYPRYVRAMQQKGERVLSLSSVMRCLPRDKFKPCSKAPYKTCKCGVCENGMMLLTAAVRNGLQGLSKRPSKAAMMVICSPPRQKSQKQNECSDASDASDAHDADILDYNIRCVRDRCHHCRNKLATILKANHGLKKSARIIYRQWEQCYRVDEKGNRVKDGIRRNLKVRPWSDVFESLKLLMVRLPYHIFTYKWQALQYEKCKETLLPNEVLMVLDFAQNVSLPPQDEIQDAYFGRAQTTMHPVVCYFRCPRDCGKLVRDDVVCLSSDKKHDAYAVDVFTQKALCHLRHKHQVVPRRIYEFCDNASSQYKNFRSFAMIARSPIQLERNYFGAHHGKGPADACIGRLKKALHGLCRGGDVDIQDSRSMYAVCREKMTNTGGDANSCFHSHRHFFHAVDIDRSCDESVLKIPGSSQFHQVRSIGDPKQILTRSLSCICRYVM